MHQSTLMELFGLLDLSTASRPSYALICEQASSQRDARLVKRDGVWMTTKHSKLIDHMVSKKFQLMDLPYDIRHIIFSYVCERRLVPVFLKGIRGMPPSAIPLPEIARAGNRRLRTEVIEVAIKQATLEIHSGPGNAQLQGWLESVDLSVSGGYDLRSGFDAVRSLSFPYFSRFPHRNPAITANNDIELMKKCINLHTIMLTWVSYELINHDFTGWDVDHATSDEDIDVAKYEMSVEKLRKAYKLDDILELKKLKQLTLKKDTRFGSEGSTALSSLREWFEEEYMARGRTVEVKVI